MPKRSYAQAFAPARRATLFDLPIKDILVTHVAKDLHWWDLCNLRRCSKRCKLIGDSMIARGLREVTVHGDGKYNLNPYPTVFESSTKLRKVCLKHQDQLSNEILFQFLTNNPLIEEFKMYWCPEITDNGLLPLRYCRNLTSLSLGHMEITGNFFRTFCEINNHLLEAIFTNLDITSEAVVEFFSKQSLLKRITLDLKYQEIDNCLLVIPECCPQLEYLDIHNAKVSPDGDEDILRIVDNCHSFRKLILNNDDFIDEDLLVEQLQDRNDIIVEYWDPENYDLEDYSSDYSSGSDDQSSYEDSDSSAEVQDNCSIM